MHDPDNIPVLFHYADFASFVGIITSKEMWATNMHCLNDEQEFLDAVKIVRSEIHRRMNEETQEYTDIGNELLEEIERVSKINIHVVAFSEEHDLLSQWRGYCADGGLSLGFSFDDLFALAKENSFYLGKCIYDRATKHDILKSLIDDRLTGATMGVRNIDKAVEHFLAEFIQWAPFFKNEAFSEEQEWRLVSRPIPNNHENVSVRATATGLIPYYKFELDHLGTDSEGRINLGFRSFTIGPHKNSEVTETALSYLFSQNKLSWREVRRSRCPYRAI